jgi:hypothetical protein
MSALREIAEAITDANGVRDGGPEEAVRLDGLARPEVDDVAVHAASVAPGDAAGAGKNDRNIPRTAEVRA